MTKIRIAPYRDGQASDEVAHSGDPFVWFDDSDPSDPGWVVRYWVVGDEQIDEPLDASDPDDGAAALAEATARLERRFGVLPHFD